MELVETWKIQNLLLYQLQSSTRGFLRLGLVFRLFVGVVNGIIALLVTGVIFNMAQVLVILLLIFLDNSDITAGDGSVKEPALPTFTVRTRIFLGLT